MAVYLIPSMQIYAVLLFYIISVHAIADFSEEPLPTAEYDLIYLEANFQYEQNETREHQLKIYCYGNVQKSFLQIWRSVYLVLEHAPKSYEMFSGDNDTDAFTKYREKSIWFPTSWLYEQDKTIGFPAFSEYCVGLNTRDSYVLSLEVRTINYWRFLQTIIGILLFLSAPSLSRNPFFHYTSGVSFGVLASLLILFYVISRFIPKKSASYLVLAFGWSFVLYILQVLWRDLKNIVSNYKDIIMVYCFVVAFLSFLVCYRFGPVENIRTFKIIQYSMQVIAVLVIFFSSEYREVSTAIVLILLTGKWIPIKWLIKFQYLWYRFFPPKVKLLTELEYIEQGHIETKKALENLRQYCRSPDCNAWKVIAKLKNPVRFAEFIENGTQYTDEELLEYNSEEFFDNEFHHSSYSDDNT